jgi:hypothetical protein
LKQALGSPAWHGDSVDAWIDSIVYGRINTVETPYLIRITGIANCSDTLRDEITLLADEIQRARAWKVKHYGEDVEVSFQIEP